MGSFQIKQIQQNQLKDYSIGVATHMINLAETKVTDFNNSVKLESPLQIKRIHYKFPLILKQTPVSPIKDLNSVKIMIKPSTT